MAVRRLRVLVNPFKSIADYATELDFYRFVEAASAQLIDFTAVNGYPSALSSLKEP